MYLGPVVGLARHPVKSMGGEQLDIAAVDERGIEGDRWWACYTPDGGIGSGKTTRRFRRVDGLLGLRAHLPGTAVPRIVYPDGTELAVDDPAADARLSEALGTPLRLATESSVAHHDESPLHVVTTAELRRLERAHGGRVDPRRFRANIVLDTAHAPSDALPEDRWCGHDLTVGDQVILRIGDPMIRCVMVDLPQPHARLPAASGLLRTIADEHDLALGHRAQVVRGGTVTIGDRAALRRPRTGPEST